MFRKVAILAIVLATSSSAFAETFISTAKGKVSVTKIAQVMANRFGKEIVITRAQIKAKPNAKTRTQKFVFTALIDQKPAKCTFVRTNVGDGIACHTKNTRLANIRVNWKTDLARAERRAQRVSLR
jgi:hypothetical protein